MLPSSASDPLAVHVKMVPTTTVVEGETVAVVMVGALLLTLTLTVALLDAAELSVAVAVHTMLSPTSVSAADTV